MPAEAGFRVTTKAPSGALLTIGGDTAEDFRTNVAAALGDDNARDFLIAYKNVLLGLVVTAPGMDAAEAQAVSNLQKAGLVAPPTATIPGATPTSPLPMPGAEPVAPPATSPAQAAPSCPHGVKIHRSGTGKNGRQWQAWMCPAPKGTPGQCEPQWIR